MHKEKEWKVPTMESFSYTETSKREHSADATFEVEDDGSFLSDSMTADAVIGQPDCVFSWASGSESSLLAQ